MYIAEPCPELMWWDLSFQLDCGARVRVRFDGIIWSISECLANSQCEMPHSVNSIWHAPLVGPIRNGQSGFCQLHSIFMRFSAPEESAVAENWESYQMQLTMSERKSHNWVKSMQFAWTQNYCALFLVPKMQALLCWNLHTFFSLLNHTFALFIAHLCCGHE